MFFYLLYRIGFFIANTLPLRLAYWVSERFADVQYIISKKDREAVRSNLATILKKDKKECARLSKMVFRNFGLYLVDFFRILKIDKEYIKNKVSIEGLQHIADVLKEGKGGIILSSHIGNWELGGVVVGVLGYDISAVAMNHSHSKINSFFIKQREAKGLKVIKMGSVMKSCISVLSKKNGLLALIGDRDFNNNGIIMDFFGMPTKIPKGPALFSLKTSAPVIPAFLIRKNRFKYKLVFEKPLRYPGCSISEKDKVLKEMTQDMVNIMEKYIKEYPEQWLVFRRFWKTPVDAFVL